MAPDRIDTVSAFNGQIGLLPCPGRGDGASLEGDLAGAVQWGARCVVTLLEANEMSALGVQRLPVILAHQPVSWHHLPIADGAIPTGEWEAQWAWIGSELRHRLRQGERIAIHCAGGRGRTGTVAARLLAELGEDPASAISRVRRSRPGAIETVGQEEYVAHQSAVSEQVPSRLSRCRGSLLGGALGDALGAAVEFASLREIRERFGPDGVRALEPAYGRTGAITDDTQMTLFCAEGMLRAQVRAALRGIGPVYQSMTRGAYLRWLYTQGVQHPDLSESGWLVHEKQLFHRRAPGVTCMSALESSDREATARNDSKGCGTVMRVAPVGLLLAHEASRPEGLKRIFRVACDDASITHGHVTGQLASGALAVLLALLVDGKPLLAAAQGCLQQTATEAKSEELIAVLAAAIELADKNPMQQAVIEQLGQGWVAEEALAIGVYCTLSADRTGSCVEDALALSVNHSGDSDSTGSITGNILGALHGDTALNRTWLQQLELRDVIEQMATDLWQARHWELGEYDASPFQDFVSSRYPGE